MNTASMEKLSGDETLPKWAVPISVLANLEQLIASLDPDRQDACHQLDAYRDYVHSTYKYLDAEKFIRILNFCSITFNAEDFGVRLSALQNMSALGKIWLTMQRAKDICSMLTEMERYFLLFCDRLYIRTYMQGETCKVEYGMLGSYRTVEKHLVEYSLSLFCREMRKLLHKPQWHPEMVYFRFKRPRDITLYREVFGENIFFNQSSNAIYISAEDLHTNINHSFDADRYSQ